MSVTDTIKKEIEKIVKNSNIKVLVSDIPIVIGKDMYHEIYFREEGKAKLRFYILLDDVLEGKYF